MQPVSAVGLTTRQCRGAGGGHQAVYVFDGQGQEAGEAVAAQQENKEQHEAEREDGETVSQREKAQAKGERRCVSTVFFRPAGPPALRRCPIPAQLSFPIAGIKKPLLGLSLLSSAPSAHLISLTA